MKKILIILITILISQTAFASSMTNNSYSFSSPTSVSMQKNMTRLRQVAQEYSNNMQQEMERFQQTTNTDFEKYTQNNNSLSDFKSSDFFNDKKNTSTDKKKEETPKWFRQESNPYEWKLD